MYKTSDTQGRLDAINPQHPGAWGLFLRHAERFPIESADDVFRAGLTDQGRRDAHALGRALRHLPIAAAISSPVQRCIDTARHILEGYGMSATDADARVTSDDTLLEGFIENGRLAREEFTRLDPIHAILEHLEGATIPGLRSVKTGAEQLLHFSLSHLRDNALTLFLTHDSIIMPLRRHWCGTRYSLEKWQPFLSGALIHQTPDAVTVDGHTAVLTPP